jgi:hypothetical protein
MYEKTCSLAKVNEVSMTHIFKRSNKAIKNKLNIVFPRIKPEVLFTDTVTRNAYFQEVPQW